MVKELSPWQMGTSIQDITLPDGTMYVGKWKNGLKHGQGTYTYSNGGKYFGKFKDGGGTWSRNSHLPRVVYFHSSINFGS